MFLHAGAHEYAGIPGENIARYATASYDAFQLFSRNYAKTDAA